MNAAPDVYAGVPRRPPFWESLLRCANERPDDEALVQPGLPSFTFGELRDSVDRLSELLSASGLSHASSIAVLLPDGAVGLLALLGALRIGTCCPVDPSLPAPELEASLRLMSVAAVIVAEDAGVPRSTAVALGLTVIAASRSGWRLVHTAHRPVAAVDDLALLISTSATTSRRKLVQLSPANLDAMLANTSACLRLSPVDTLLLVARQFHIQGILSPLAQWLAGGRVIAPPAFSAIHFERWLHELEPTWYACGPATHRAILAQLTPACAAVPHRLRFIRSGGSTLSPALQDQLAKTFQVPVLNVYGLTETGALTSTDLEETTPAGSVGRSVGPHLAILGKTGHLLPPGAEGEIVVRGATVMQRYRNDASANRDAFHEGWFRTGDLGHLDQEGFLYLSGRLKEIINRGGQKIIPDEIDAVLEKHPDVLEAAAFAIPHPTLGEDVGCAAVVRPGVTGTQLRSYLRTQVAAYRVPAEILLLDRLPRGSTGKPRRLELGRYAASLALAKQPVPDALPDSRQDPDAPGVQLRSIWCRILHRSSVGADEDFFQAGGDSLAALAMLLEVEQLFDCAQPLSSESFIDRPTLAGLLAQVNAAQTQQTLCEASAVVHPVHNGAPGPPVFLLPANTDTGLYFRRLARHMAPACSVVLVRPIDRGPFGTLYAIEDAAEVAASAVRNLQPQGPYTLGGYCQGGILAFATASLLEGQGQTVRLVLFDTPAPPAATGRGSARDRVRSQLAADRRSFRSVIATGRGIVRRLFWLTLRRLRPWLHRTRHLAPVRRLLSISTPRIFWLYHPQINRGHVLHFVATEKARWADRATENWKSYTSGESTSVPVSGNHHTIFDESNLAYVASELQAWLKHLNVRDGE